MAINYIKGNLLSVTGAVIAHGCNAAGGFGTGVAGQIKVQYPEVCRAYKVAHAEGRLRLGEVVFAESRGKLFANCITQPKFGYDGGKYVDYEAIRSCMRVLNSSERVRRIGAIVLPLIGAGKGGGSWPVISEILSDELKDVAFSVYTIDGKVPGSPDMAEAPDLFGRRI